MSQRLSDLGRDPGANAVVNNVFDGQTFEFARQLSTVEIGITSTVADTRFTAIIGDQIVAQDQGVSNAARVPIAPDDFLDSGIALPGDRIVVGIRTVTDPTGIGINTIAILRDLA